jgi:hypothetical protein
MNKSLLSSFTKSTPSRFPQGNVEMKVSCTTPSSVRSVDDFTIVEEKFTPPVTQPVRLVQPRSDQVKALSSFISTVLDDEGKDDHSVTVLLPDTKSKVFPRVALSSPTLNMLFGDRVYPFRISTVLSISSNGAGIINSVVQTSTVLPALSTFSALSTVFDEFFVKEFELSYQPVSYYNGPIGFVNTTNESSLPLGISDHQNDLATYSSISSQSNNFRFAYHNTGNSWHYKWMNTQDPSMRIVTTVSLATQSWCTISNAANYTGLVQMLTPAISSAALPVSAIVGFISVQYDVLFRIRNM